MIKVVAASEAQPQAYGFYYPSRKRRSCRKPPIEPHSRSRSIAELRRWKRRGSLQSRPRRNSTMGGKSLDHDISIRWLHTRLAPCSERTCFPRLPLEIPVRKTLGGPREKWRQWNIRNSERTVNTPAGTYLSVALVLDGRRRVLQVHRVAYALATCAWPKNEIDHINRCASDNRLANLTARRYPRCITRGTDGAIMARRDSSTARRPSLSLSAERSPERSGSRSCGRRRGSAGRRPPAKRRFLRRRGSLERSMLEPAGDRRDALDAIA